jgi:hypothetical protein
MRVTVRDLPGWWTERPLPDSVKAWPDTGPVQTPPRNAELPVDREAVLRYEARNGERAIVYLSSEYDPPGELPAAGMWFARTIGGRWAAPLYLGLQQHFPYVATRGSKLPLLEGNRLRLEVRVREIDSSTITFPPISLDLKRSADSLYLDFDLTVLAADRDSDGLTDIEERRVGLDFTKPDTDGDGVPDGLDPLPLVAYRASAALRDQAARAIVAGIVGHSPAPIIVPVGRAPTIENMIAGDPSARAASQRTRTRFLIADPPMFAHVATPFRLIVYAPQDIAALGRGAAPFYPPQVTWLFSSPDGRQHYVVWSAGWTGGSFILTCGAASGAGCTTTKEQTWIS